MAKYISQIIGYIVSIFLLLYVIMSILWSNQLIDVIGVRTFVVVSTSMEPDINKNDLIVITRTKEERLQVGDAITFYVHIPELGEKSFVTHYIGDIVDDNGTTIYKTQGANQDPNDFDEWRDNEGNPVDITMDDIEGKYWFRIPKVGIAINLLRDPIFAGLLVINGVIIYFLIKYIKDMIHDKKNNEKETE